jgi:hypothetical protein
MVVRLLLVVHLLLLAAQLWVGRVLRFERPLLPLLQQHHLLLLLLLLLHLYLHLHLLLLLLPLHLLLLLLPLLLLLLRHQRCKVHVGGQHRSDRNPADARELKAFFFI